MSKLGKLITGLKIAAGVAIKANELGLIKVKELEPGKPLSNLANALDNLPKADD